MLDIDITQNEFCEEELDKMVEVLDMAKKITDDSALFRLLQKHMGKQVDDIKSLDDLRSKYQEKSLKDSDD